MALRTIHLNGFKSFANDTKINLYHPVTAIVGPNGSGKSNVADAIRFALGEQSMKSLRGGKGEDLIFNGSHKIGRKNRAHVSLLFDNKNKLFDLDSTEVEVQRLVHRDGVNEYLVNSDKVRLKDKLELIASANIGPSGHHLITQGEADKFVTATDSDRRLLIEDALGLNLYKLRRKEAFSKLDKTEEKLENVNKLVWELEPRVSALSKEVEALESLKQKENTLIKLYAEMFYFWQKFLADEELRLHNKKGDLEGKISDKKKIIDELVDQTSETEQLSQSEIELGSKKKKQSAELESLLNKKSQLDSELGQIEGGLSSLDDRRSKLIKQLRSHESANKISTISVSANQVHLLHTQIQEASSLLAAKQAEEKFYTDCVGGDNGRDESVVELWQAELFEIEEKLTNLHGKLQEKQIKIRSFTNDINQLRQDIDRTENEIRQASSERLGSIRRLEQLRFEYEKITEELSATNQAIDDLKVDNTNYKERKHRVSSLYGRDAIDTPAVHLNHNDELKTRLNNTKREVLRLEAQLEEADMSALPKLSRELDAEASRLTHLQSEKHDVEISLSKTKELVGELTNQIETQIEVGLAQVNTNLEKFFRVLFGGGSCMLRSVKDGDKKGVSIELQLPYKRIKSVNSLSGGERSLASLAILFAITLLSPPPFVVLDETDAALDEANSRRYAKLVRELAEYTQLILITHNRETMTFADELYGVTMGSDGVSRLLSVTLREAEVVAKN